EGPLLEPRMPGPVPMGDDRQMRLVLLGVGAMNSPRYRPAGLSLRSRGRTLVIDGGDPHALPEQFDDWLVCDEHAELMPQIRRLAGERGIEPRVSERVVGDVVVTPLPVVHTSHPTYGYLLTTW